MLQVAGYVKCEQEHWKSRLVTYDDTNKTQSFVKINKMVKC